VKTEDIVNAECLQLEDDRRQVAALHLRNSGDIQLVERVLFKVWEESTETLKTTLSLEI